MSVLLRHVQGARRSSPRRLRPAGLALIAVLSAGALSLLIGSAFGAKVVLGTLGSSGSGVGEMSRSLWDVAVNYGGAGGASAGDVYVLDNGNHRIDQFHSDGSFVRAFGWGVRQGDAAPYSFDVCTDSTGCQAGQSGAGAGQLSGRPAGIAVDQGAGNLYVTDQNNYRVDVFSAAGDFEGAFGYGVVAGDVAPYSLDFCTPATGCQAGQSGPAAGQISDQVPDVAVDPSSGNIYIADQANNRIDEFKPALSGGAVTGIGFVKAMGWDVIPSGAPGDTGSGFEACTTASGCQVGASGYGPGEFATKALESIAIDSTGAIYAVSTATFQCGPTTPCRVQKFTPDSSAASGYSAADFAPDQLTITETAASNLVAAQQIAVDPSDDHVFVAQAQGGSTRNVYGIREFTPSGIVGATSPPGLGISGTARGLAVGIGSSLYFATGVAVAELGPAPAPTAAVLPATDVTTTTATFNGTVTPPNGGYDTTYHFEYSSDGVSWQHWPDHEVDVGSSHASVTVSQQVSGLEPSANYEVRLVATTGSPVTTSTTTFSTADAPPSISGTVATDVTAAAATLTGYVTPNNRSTTYHFEWGKDTSYSHRLPAFEAFAGSGGTPVRVSANITGLDPRTTYHFRIVANSLSGTMNGRDQRFTTLNQAGLPDGRAYELVSPADKGPVGYVNEYLGTEIRFQVSLDGQRVAYPITYGLANATAGGPVRYLASRGPSGWLSTQLTPPALAPPRLSGAQKNDTGTYLYFSPDLSCGVVASPEPLAHDAPEAVLADGGYNLYRRNSDGTFTTLSNVEPTNPGAYTGSGGLPYGVDAVSGDCSHVVFHTIGAHNSSYTYPGIGASGLYEWSDGTLRNVGVLPDGTTAAGAQAGFQNVTIGSVRNAISRDGSRIFFSATSDEGGDSGKTALFMRAGGKTTDISQSQTATPDQGAFYQLASASGDQVLFLANYGLTAATSSGPTSTDCSLYSPPDPCDLYDYDVTSGVLTDLSADGNPADSNGATVAGVLGASEDASYVYFAAQGQLVQAEGRTYAQNAAGATYNVYLAHGGDLAFVGLVRQDDLTGNPSGDLITKSISSTTSWRSQVTADGEHLLFSSRANVTGYDSGGVAEAYLYSAKSGTAACVSCRPDGRPSVGDGTTSPIASGGGLYYLTPFHRPVALSEDGQRVFFDMPDVLAAGAKKGQSNIYEWHDGEVYLLATGDAPSVASTDVGAWNGLIFQGASVSGNDVFITTSQPLVPADTDDRSDVYDIRVGGGFSAPEQPRVPCDPVSGACQGPSAVSPAFGPIGSVSVTGYGNAPPAARSVRRKRTLALPKPSRRARRKLARRGRGSIPVRIRGGGRVHVRGTAKIRGHRALVVKASRIVRRKRAKTVSLRVVLSRAARHKLARRGRLRVRFVARIKGVTGAKRRTILLRRAPNEPRARKARRLRAARSREVERARRTIKSDRGGVK